MSKQTISSNSARAALMRGVDAVANPVKVTLGPRGRNVMLDRPGQPIATRDGVTVAKEVSNLPDPFENMGAAYAREVADAAVTEAGDGTTTSSVLLQAIVRSGLAAVDAGAEPLMLADGINLAAAACVESIKKMAIPYTPELIEQVAVVSMHGDKELGKIIAEMALRTGEHGVMELAESRDHNTTVEYLEGFYFERGWQPYDVFVTAGGDGQKYVLDDPMILLSERVIVGGKGGVKGDHLFNVLQLCVTARRPLLIVADDLTGDALNLFVTQIAAGTIPGGCFVKLPGFGPARTQALKDLQIAIGAKRIHTQTSTRAEDVLSEFTLDDLGTCKQAIISPTRTILIEGLANQEVLKKRLTQLKRQSEDAGNPWEKEQLDHRIARLSGGVAILKVGAHSEPAMIEKKARAEDAIHACRGAMMSGVVPGGGLALLRAAQENLELKKVEREPSTMTLGNVQAGRRLLLMAMREPALQIIRNAGNSDGGAENIVALMEAGEGDAGFDASRNLHCNMYEAGIVDPAKVVMVALSKSASIGALLLTTEVLISDVPQQIGAMQASPAMFRG